MAFVNFSPSPDTRFVDVIPVSAVLYIINFANCYKNDPQKLENKLRKEKKIKKAITIEKNKEIVQKYESGFRVTDLANIYNMSKSTISTILLVFLVNYAHYTTLLYYEKFR
jgi:DNA-binding protein Fis